MSNIVPVNDIERMARAVAASKLFGVKNTDEAMALMLIAQAEGNHPAIAARDYHIIQGKPALKADAMLARFQQAGGKVVWGAYNDKEVSGTFSHAQGGSVEITWTIDMARAAGLANKDTWKNYPRQMLRARVISEGIRTVYPGVAVGTYTVEEAQDFAPAPRSNGHVMEADYSEVVDTDKAVEIDLLIVEVGADKEKFLRYMGVDDVRQIPASQYERAISSLRAKEKKNVA